MGQSPTHCDSHYVGAPRGILRDPGNVVVRGELGDIVVGVQELDHYICCGAELFRGVHFNGQELGEERKRGLVWVAITLQRTFPLPVSALDQRLSASSHFLLSAAIL